MHTTYRGLWMSCSLQIRHSGSNVSASLPRARLLIFHNRQFGTHVLDAHSVVRLWVCENSALNATDISQGDERNLWDQ